MAIYTVLIPRDGAAASDPLATVFVKEGFCWPAFFFTVLWLLFRRLWMVLIGVIVVAVALGSVAAAFGPPVVGAALVLLRFLFALEANEFRRWTLLRHGHRLAGMVEARGLEEAEIRYFASLDTASPGSAAPPPPAPPAPPPPPAPTRVELGMIPPSAEAGDVVGLFPAPGGAS